MRFKRITGITLFILCLSFSVQAEVKLPVLISDGMVLQRDAKVPVWGWADPGEKITLSFKGKKYKTTTAKDGKWSIKLPKMKAGGPFKMTISGKNELEVNDILIGDVWLCTGQSNMVHQLDIHDVRYAEEIASANNPNIRHFKVPTTPVLSGPENDLTGGEWQKAVGEEVRPFSAVAYFFAKKIYEKYQIPIGLINASVGGTPIEAWIPEEGYTNFPEKLEIIEENKNTAFVNRQKQLQPVNSGPKEIRDKGLTGALPWYDVNFEPKNWRRINIPGYWEDQGIKDLNGVVWYRREVEIPKSMVGKKARLFMGRIVDADEVYINGILVGNKTYQYPQRRYDVPDVLLKPGKNTFTIKVTNYNGKGGFVPDKPYYIFTEQDTVDLKGYWQYKVGEVFKPFDRSAFANRDSGERVRRINPQNEPAALYNGMIAPYVQLPVKGILWYQGESNTGNPQVYDEYMTALISGLRSVLQQPEAPFIYAQLPNFMDVSYLPEESSWAELRESQLKALQNSNTAMTVNIDLGEWNDIHPDNKKDVGERMALAGLKLAYNEDLVYSGPIYKSSSVEDGKVILTFEHTGSGLVSNDGEPLSEFALAGQDGKFVWANAKIEGDRVIVWSDEIPEPKYLRYAWADNPDNPNLYNKEGLPASPFRIEL
ncbi:MULTISPECIES: sialate O-acetylesterase [unclassified Leeuwenhoekiella]|uniref:sialate O-acetylesterase n=1 Tax=unclassified Leeuwenhoekiella TaxID=2615029 RepID=UPI000C5584B6|nr:MULTISPECIES: sialate O-acetylesterase [unclassified Leeuwenhoekiella]MAW94810.1 sialate O-acetylesterase [Leeuwenhoekiella sp.]MBA79530.1 sialate O-acetylesterase [Leeuwenhoekiella sp.]|tara:strand:- start:33389 stop:35347 length:1959 start_codon:yes stop_codon:yes gene_type:complete